MAALTSGFKSRWPQYSHYLRSRLQRYDFTVMVMVALGALLALLIWVSVDFLRAIQYKDEQLQAVGLRNQLVEFILVTTREPDGSSLLDSPEDFSQLRRPLKVVTVRKPFFGYFLTRENAKSFRKDTARVEPPRACVLEYPVDIDSASQSAPDTVQVCLAAVQNDPYGRYVYAIVRYPIGSVKPHRRGRPLKGSDSVQLSFRPEFAAPITLHLAMEVPRLPAEARRRNPARFDGLYEVAGFLNADGTHPTSFVNGQAIERAEQPDGPRFVTLAIRIDAAVFNSRGESWPDAALKRMGVGLQIRRADLATILIPESQKGSAQASLAQAYLTSVPSGATLDIYKDGGTREMFWSSKSLEQSRKEAASGWMQWIGSKIAEWLKGDPIRASKTIASPGAGVLVAEVSSSGSVISDVAARVIALLGLSAILVVFLAALLIYVAQALGQITADAMKVARRKHGEEWEKYKGKRNQIEVIGRVIRYLDRRIRGVVERKAKTLAREEAAISQHKLGLRLIAHEIRSPVATLLLLNQQEGENKRLLERMQRAIEIFTDMRNVEAVKESAHPAVHDLAEWLSAYAMNMSSDDFRLTYQGPQSGVMARYDDILLDQIMDNLLDNARRYALPGTVVELRLTTSDRRDVELEVFNQGAPVEDTENIFLCGVTSADTSQNSGFGLYAARQYVNGFNGSIHAENREKGFAIVVRLERA